MRQLIVFSFILFLLSCSSNSSEFFKTYNEQSENSIELIEFRNNYYYKNIEEGYNYNRSKMQRWFSYTKKIKEKTSLIKQKVDSLIKLSNNEIVDKELTLKRLNVRHIRDSLVNLNKFFLSVIKNPERDSGLVMAMSKNNKAWETIEMISKKKLTTEEYIATLQKIKLDLVINQYFMYQYLYQYIAYDDCFGFSNTGIFVIPNAQTIRKGETFNAEILFASYDTTFSVDYEIEGKRFAGNNGKIIYQTKATEIGTVSKNGNFIIKDYRTGKDSLIPFTIQYEVLKD
jgi:hypothetical protein